MNLLTRSEELTLLAVWNLQENAYGATIRQRISDVTGHEWSFGAVYVPLERLVGKRYVDSFKGEATSKRGGRRKRYFTLTHLGRAALTHIRSVQDELWASTLPVPEVR